MKKINYLVVVSMVVMLLVSGCRGRINLDKGELTPPNNQENPLQQEDPKDPPKEEKNIARIIFAGDTMMDSKVAVVMDEKGNDYPLMEFMPLLKDSDLVVLNLETAVGTSRSLMEKTYAFQTHPSRFSLFEPIKEKLLFSLANNHGMDAPLKETMTEMKKIDIPYIGVGEKEEEAYQPYLTEINGVSLGIFAASRVIPDASWTVKGNQPGMATVYSYEPLITYIKEWQGKVDHIIVLLHWGEELADLPNKHQENLEEKLIESGVDIIIGGHPHVIQEVKWRETGQITAFSLGNFVFTTSRQAKANDLIALELHLSKEKIELVRALPGEIHFGLIKSLKGKEEAQRVYNRLRNLSPTIQVDDEGIITPKK